MYKDKLSEVDCSYIEDKLNEAESGDEVVSIDNITSIVEDVSKLLKDVASDSGMSKPVMAKPSKSRRRSLPHKPWYNSDCEITRRTMLRYKNKYRKLKNVENLNLLQNPCKIYKRNINKAYRDYENELIKKIRKLQSENPREYWKIIQGKRGPNSIPNISLETFRKHFQNLTSGTQTNVEHKEERPVSDQIPSLNEPFKDQDILKAIKQLKNNKAAGHDLILKSIS